MTDNYIVYHVKKIWGHVVLICVSCKHIREVCDPSDPGSAPKLLLHSMRLNYCCECDADVALSWRRVGASACPSGWSAYEGNCYEVKTTFKKHQQARQKCQESGADLTSINSAAEAAFIQSLLYVLFLCNISILEKCHFRVTIRLAYIACT